MQRRILIIDDHDDLATALREKYSQLGHEVMIIESRREALCAPEIENFDLVITDLDDSEKFVTTMNRKNGNGSECLPEFETAAVAAAANHTENVKAFKICGTNFRRDEFNEDELKTL